MMTTLPSYQLINKHEILECLEFYKTIFIREKNFKMQIHDRYTDQALHYALRNNNEIIAAYRIILGKSRSDFPVGEFTELPPIQNASYAEFSRLAVHPDYRGGKISLLDTFASLAWHGKQLGITHFLGEPTLDLVGFYEHFGFKRYGEPFLDTSVALTTEPNSILILAAVEDLYKKYSLHLPNSH